MLLHYQQGKVRWQNSSVEKSLSSLSNVAELHQINSHQSRLCPVSVNPPPAPRIPKSHQHTCGPFNLW